MCGAEKVRHMLMGEQVLKKWKKSKKMTVAFGGILVMSVVIGGWRRQGRCQKEH